MTSSDPATPTAGQGDCAEPVEGGEQPWYGGFVPFVVGDPGAAALRVVAGPAADFPDQRDIVIDGVTFRDESGIPVAHLRAASIRGLSHRYYGKVRQDSYAFRASADGRWLVLAVADGVSAGARSHLAAATVTREGCRLLANSLVGSNPAEVDWGGLLGDLAGRIVALGQEALVSAGVVEEAEPGEDTVAEHMSTTALFAIVGRTPTELGNGDAVGGDVQWPVYCVAVGDSSAWVLTPGQQTPWRPVICLKAEEDGLASSATSALPLTLGGDATVTAETLVSGEVLALVTDGIGDPLGDGTGDVGRFLASVWTTPPRPLEFAAHVDFARRSYDDDRTAVVVWMTAAG